MSLLGALGSAVSGAVGDFGSAFLSQYFNKKNMRDQARLQYAYAERYAKNSPTWNIEGLRTAGLNPMLAVSNGVNLGANIPNITNSSPKADINVPMLDALRASNDIDVSRKNAESNATTAQSQSTSAAAEMIRAKSDAALKQAQTAETLQRTKFEGQGEGFKNDTVNDLIRGAKAFFNSAQEFNKESEHYLEHGPAPRDFRDTLSDTERKVFDEVEKQNGKGSAIDIIPGLRDKHDSWRLDRSRSHSSIFTR